MKKLCGLALLLVCSFNILAMKQAQQHAKVGSVTLQLELKDATVQELPKAVVIVAPTPMSARKTELYFNKNEANVRVQAKVLIDLAISLMHHNENGLVAYAQDPEHAHWNHGLCSLLLHPQSKFIYQAGESSIFLERDLGGDKNNWYYTEQCEITKYDTSADKGLCTPLTIQCHHDKAGVHDKIRVSVLEKFYAESGMPIIIVEETGRPLEYEELKKSGAALVVKTFDDRLRTMAMIFVTTYPKYKHIVVKK